ncbi:MAG TPA: SWIM zinc finger family protein, partial [Streptomyces sp.]|nr:SWIM zinc finger family protein [Streptomyces sp.]
MVLSHGEEARRSADQAARRAMERVLGLAPDDKSRASGRALGSERAWSGAGHGGAGIAWGLCTDGGNAPHRTLIDANGPAYSCSCTSERPPCAHVLGLSLLVASGAPMLEQDQEPPPWAAQWLADRCGRAAAQA